MAKKIYKQVLDKKCRQLKIVAKDLNMEKEVSTPSTEVSTPEVMKKDSNLGNKVSTPNTRSVDS